MSISRHHCSTHVSSNQHIKQSSASASNTNPPDDFHEPPSAPGLPMVQDVPCVTSSPVAYASDTTQDHSTKCSQSSCSFVNLTPGNITKNGSFDPYDLTNSDWCMQVAPDTPNPDFCEISFDSVVSCWSSHVVTRNPRFPAATRHESEPAEENRVLDGSASARRPLAIPELGSPERVQLSRTGLYYQLQRLTDFDSVRIQRSIKVALERPLWEPISMDSFPSKEILDRCIDLFFRNWNPVLPSYKPCAYLLSPY